MSSSSRRTGGCQFTDHKGGLPDPRSFPPMWQSWLHPSPISVRVHFTSDLACLYCAARVSVGRHKNVRYFLSIIPWLRPLDRCSVQTGYCGKRQVLGHFIDFTAADIIQQFLFVFFTPLWNFREGKRLPVCRPLSVHPSRLLFSSHLLTFTPLLSAHPFLSSCYC